MAAGHSNNSDVFYIYCSVGNAAGKLLARVPQMASNNLRVSPGNLWLSGRQESHSLPFHLPPVSNLSFSSASRGPGHASRSRRTKRNPDGKMMLRFVGRRVRDRIGFRRALDSRSDGVPRGRQHQRDEGTRTSPAEMSVLSHVYARTLADVRPREIIHDENTWFRVR